MSGGTFFRLVLLLGRLLGLVLLRLGGRQLLGVVLEVAVLPLAAAAQVELADALRRVEDGRGGERLRHGVVFRLPREKCSSNCKLYTWSGNFRGFSEARSEVVGGEEAAKQAGLIF